ncbi:hypothetical protein [Nocardiopsis sp. CNR-923]|uniref:hypothetical protein n=1 Tax=Nocardiopsis sp. CNR-923 TaxID=1904965 RepID=UPI0021CC671E|nr:hypothetical protein [Nocardiopsis sp. CNR-923]
MTPPLIAVIGPLETPLLQAWIEHYRTLGIDDFHLALHLPEHALPGTEHRLREALARCGIVPAWWNTAPGTRPPTPTCATASEPRPERSGT